MNNTDLQNIGNVLSGKQAISVTVPTQTILMIGVTIFLAVLLSVILANAVTK